MRMFSVDDLTPEQRAVIAYPLECDLCVEAPAGHGKTTTAMLKAGEAARALLHSRRQQVLVLTFSKMAVRQIDREKKQHVPAELHPRILIRTYHAFYFDLIRRYAQYLGFDHGDLDLLTTEERRALYRAFSVSHPALSDDGFYYSQYLHAGLDPPMPVTGVQPGPLVAAAASWLEEYHKAEHRLGFDDFPFYAYRILADSAFVRSLLSYKYPVVFLDEFQNTNELQWAILRLFTADSKLVVFADPNQIIHGFRGAGRALERLNEDRKPGHMPLNTNFRNSDALYAFASSIATGRFDAPCPASVALQRLAVYRKDKWSVKFDIHDAFRQSIRSIGLLAATNQTVQELSSLLARETRKTRIIGHEVVQDSFVTQDKENVVLAILQFASSCDPCHLRVVAGALSACARGNANYTFYLNQAVEVGQCTAECVRREEGVPGVANARRVLAALESAVEGGAAHGPDDAWARAEKILDSLKNIRTLPDLTGPYTSLRSKWELLCDREGAPTLETYLRHVRVERRRQNFLEQRSYTRGVFVMTLHQSQGKQFDAVFIWACNDGVIPHADEIKSGDTSPSQHLLYVGITRARYLVRIYYEQSERWQPSRLIVPFLPTR